MELTVKGLIDKLKELGAQAQAGGNPAVDPPVIFAVANHLNFCLSIKDINDIEPNLRLGCGCWDGVIFKFTSAPGNPANGQPLALQTLIGHLECLNKEIGCDGERISSHKAESNVHFHLSNPDLDFSLELQSIAVQRASTLAQPQGIVFNLIALED